MSGIKGDLILIAAVFIGIIVFIAGVGGLALFSDAMKADQRRKDKEWLQSFSECYYGDEEYQDTIARMEAWAEHLEATGDNEEAAQVRSDEKEYFNRYNATCIERRLSENSEGDD